jgi:predicted DNA-binding WGR domain protein
MTTPDFRDEEPVWVTYAEWIDDDKNHDKFYEIRIDMDDDGTLWLTKRWGRRPDTGAGQIKVERCNTLPQAIAVANTMLGDKTRKGYRVTERPYGASNKVTKEYGKDYYADEEAF